MLKLFDQIPSDKKVLYLVVSFFLFLLLAYNLSIKNTLEVYSSYNQSKNNAEKAENSIQRISYALSEINSINNQLHVFKVDSAGFHHQLLGITGKYCQTNRLLLKELSSPRKEDENDFSVATTTIVTQGAFVPTLKLIHYYEKVMKLGRISSVKFEILNDIVNKNRTLQATIYLQTIIKK